MPNQINTQLNNANLSNANLQGQIAVQVGHSLVMDSLQALDTQRKQTEIDSLRSQLNSRPAPLPASTGDSPELLYKHATVKRELAETRESLNVREKEVELLLEAVKERDAILIEWMHSNTAFKRLSKEYGKQLGHGTEQVASDFYNEALSAAEEDPDFMTTKLHSKSLQKLSAKI